MPGKFGAVKTRCSLGHNHPSKGEAEYCEILHLQLKSRVNNLVDIKYEEKYELSINGVKLGIHKPDWTQIHKDGSRSVVEFKGYPTALWKWKKKHFEAQYPDIPYTVISRYSSTYKKPRRIKR